MQVKDAIRILSEYEDKDQEIFIEWWDKETAEGNVDRSLTDKQWEELVLFLEDFEQPYGTHHHMYEFAWDERKMSAK